MQPVFVATLASALVLQSTALAQQPAQPNQAPASSSSPGIYKMLDTRLPETPKYSIAVESLWGAQVALFEDPDTSKKRYFIMPFLLPDWGALDNAIKTNCSAPRDELVQVTLPIEFFRETVRDEVARIASKIGNVPIRR